MQQVLLADSCQLIRIGMREVVKTVCPDAAFVEVATFADAYAALKGNGDFTLVLLDATLPDCEGMIGLFQIRAEFPEIPVVLISNQSDRASVDRATECGAAGLVLKTASSRDMIRALAAIMRGDRWFSPPVPQNDDGGEVDAIAMLSPAQFRILVGLQRGLRNKQIAYEMGVTEKTVKAYTTTMYRKLGVSSRTQALLLARKVFTEQNPH